MCENCGLYKMEGKEPIFTYGVIVMIKKKSDYYIPVVKEEDLEQLRKTFKGRKELRIWSNGQIKKKYV